MLIYNVCKKGRIIVVDTWRLTKEPTFLIDCLREVEGDEIVAAFQEGNL